MWHQNTKAWNQTAFLRIYRQCCSLWSNFSATWFRNLEVGSQADIFQKPGDLIRSLYYSPHHCLPQTPGKRSCLGGHMVFHRAMGIYEHFLNRWYPKQRFVPLSLNEKGQSWRECPTPTSELNHWQAGTSYAFQPPKHFWAYQQGQTPSLSSAHTVAKKEPSVLRNK